VLRPDACSARPARAGPRVVRSSHGPTTRRAPRDAEWQLVKPHHSGRVAADIPLPVGTNLYALVGGTVTYAGPAGSCGNTVTVHTPDQQADVTYCHLSHVEVEAGEPVAAGHRIGRSGGAAGAPGAGTSTGPHLHLQITTAAGRRCPQALLLGLWRGWPVPTIAALRTDGCTYTRVLPAPVWPAPIPPDLPRDGPGMTSRSAPTSPSADMSWMRQAACRFPPQRRCEPWWCDSC
jgi:murein DD-endopeptidase MepM/ murein hydrolase activator NlpD